MFHDRTGPGDLSYFPCHYGMSRVTYRGPQICTDAPYLAFLGGSETFGPFVEAPFPTLVAEACGAQALNLGVRNAGPDVMLNARGVLDLTHRAAGTVVQVPLVANLSNQFYRVHPRRNDRFLCITEDLRARAKLLDMCEVHFIGHFWAELARQSPEIAETVRKEVQRTWVERMQLLLSHVAPPVYLLWVEPWGPAQRPARDASLPIITSRMLQALAPQVVAQINVRPSQSAQDEGASTLVFDRQDRAKAAYALNAAAHREVADAVLSVMDVPMKKARA